MVVVELVAEDYTSLGGPMGSEETPVIFRKTFTSITKAKEAAAGDYRKREKSKAAKIEWQTDGKDLTSGDLRYICYTISKVKVM